MSAPRRYPMDFTGAHLAEGTLYAWLAFVALNAATAIVFSVVQSITAPGSAGSAAVFIVLYALYSAAFALPVALVGGFVVWPIAHGLRRVSSVLVHLVAYACLGAAVYVGFLAVMTGGFRDLSAAALGWYVAPACVIAVPLGWWITYRRKQRRDAATISPALPLPADQ